MKIVSFVFTLHALLPTHAAEPIHLHQQNNYSIIEKSGVSRKLRQETVTSHLLNAYRLETWYYQNQYENESIINGKSKNLKDVSQVILARYKMQSGKLTDFIKLFCSKKSGDDCGSADVKKVKNIAGRLTKDAYHNDAITEANTLVREKFMEVLGRPVAWTLSNPRSLAYRVLDTYYNKSPDLQFNKIPVKPPFEIQTAKITQRQWFEVLGYNPAFFSEKVFCRSSFQKIRGVKLCPEHPVESFSYAQLQDFIRKLGEFDESHYYALPTNQQWTEAASPLEGVSDLENYAWTYENSNLQTNPATKKPNTFGLYDMFGNLFEMVAPDENEIKKHPENFPITLKGANWYMHRRRMSVKNSWPVYSTYTPFDMGARLVRKEKSPSSVAAQNSAVNGN